MRRPLCLPLCFAAIFAMANFYTHYFQGGESLGESLSEGGSLLVVCGFLWLWPVLLERLSGGLKLQGLRGLTLRLACGYVSPFLYCTYILLASQEPLERSLGRVLGDSAAQILFGMLVIFGGSVCLAVAHYLLFSLGGVFRRR
ncbi:MAG TPA: hypothetical protein DD471_02515 [Planctomycetes bacterium]|nr:hypothetical protein [Planctomycetota bacterium]